jgi:hypothetical protein
VNAEQLAIELAERNERCGHIHETQICLKPKQHKNEHVLEPIERVIPFS